MHIPTILVFIDTAASQSDYGSYLGFIVLLGVIALIIALQQLMNYVQQDMWL